MALIRSRRRSNVLGLFLILLGAVQGLSGSGHDIASSRICLRMDGGRMDGTCFLAERAGDQIAAKDLQRLVKALMTPSSMAALPCCSLCHFCGESCRSLLCFGREVFGTPHAITNAVRWKLPASDVPQVLLADFPHDEAFRAL